MRPSTALLRIDTLEAATIFGDVFDGTIAVVIIAAIALGNSL
jgi:hypothetical protein